MRSEILSKYKIKEIIKYIKQRQRGVVITPSRIVQCLETTTVNVCLNSRTQNRGSTANENY